MKLSSSLPMTQGTFAYRGDLEEDALPFLFDQPREQGEGDSASSGTNDQLSIVNYQSLVLIGNYGATNIGDEAVLAGLLKLFANVFPGVFVTVLSYDPARTQKEHGCPSLPLLPFGARSFLRFGWLKTIRILWRADRVYVGGGALFTDEKIFAMFLWGYHVVLTKLLCGHVELIANTIGPLKTRLGRGMMRLVLRLVSNVTVRDSQSLQVLDDLWHSVETRHFTPLQTTDPAFLLDPVPTVERKKRIIVSLRPWISFPANFLSTLASWMDEKIEEGYEFILLPFQTLHDDDRTILKELLGVLENKERAILIEEPQTLHETLVWIASSELVIGMRLHSLILATLQTTPFLALSYSDKVRNFCEDIRMGEWCLNLSQVTETTLHEKTRKIFEHAEAIKAQLNQQREEKKEMASRMLSLEGRV